MTDFKTKYKTLFTKYDIVTKLRHDNLMSQLEAESGLKPIREDGYYKDILTLRKIFKTPFLGKDDTFVSQYLRNSEKLFNYVYANRMGNGNVASGDGYKYRAGGFIGITGKDNYKLVSHDTGIDFVGNPDLMNTEVNALIVSLWLWKKNNLNKYADRGDIDAISDIINIGKQTESFGDANHFDTRLKLYRKYEKLDY